MNLTNYLHYIWQNTWYVPINKAFFLVIIFLFFITALKLLWKLKNIRRGTKSGYRYIQGVTLDNINQKFEEISKKFRQDSYFSDLWREFDESLRKIHKNGKVFYYNTVEFSYFFNEDTLYFNKFKSDFWFSVPTLLTGIGILGTFFGLVIGLKPFQAVNFDSQSNIRHATEMLLSGIGTSFLSSLWGIAFSLVLNGTSTILRDHTIQMISKFTDHVEAIFPRHLTAEGEGLFEIKHELEKQTNALESFSTKLANAVVDGIDKSISTNLQPTIDKMSQVMEKFAQENTSSIVNTLRETFDQFKDQISGAARKETEQLLGITHAAAEAIATSQKSFEALMGNMQSTMHKQESLASSSTEEMEKMIEQFGAFEGRFAELNKLSESHKDTLRAAQNLIGNIEKVGEITEQLNMSSLGAIKAGELYQSSASELREFAENMQQILNQSSEIFDYQQVAITKLMPSVEQTLKMMYDLKQPISNMKEIMSEVKAAEGIRAETYERVDSIVDKIDQLSDSFEKHSETVQQTLVDFERTAHSAQTIWKEFEISFQGLSDSLHKGVEEYTDRIRTKTNEVFRHYDEQLATGIDRLRAGIDMIAERTEEIAEDLEHKPSE